MFLFSDAFITRGRVDRGLALGRAIVAAFMAPLLALAMARNRQWRVDIHVSRQVVLHTATLGASGCFLLAVAVVAMLLRGFGGDWGLVLQLAMLFGSIVVLATVLSSGNLRRRLKYLISRNFFTHRYDYRVEWLKFIELVSEPKHGEELAGQDYSRPCRIRRQPGGVLWSLSRGIGYDPTAAWKLPAPADGKLRARRPVYSRISGWRLDTGTHAGGDRRDSGRSPPNGHGWPFRCRIAGRWWALSCSIARNITVSPDWEAFDLLRAAGPAGGQLSRRGALDQGLARCRIVDRL